MWSEASFVWQVFAKGVVVVLNLALVSYVIANGYQRSFEWQVSFLIACMTQLFVEIFILGTSECLWIQMYLPNFNKTDMQKLYTTVQQTLAALYVDEDSVNSDTNSDTSSHMSSHKSSQDMHILNSVDHLFSSHRLASFFPTLFESDFVRLYRACSNLPQGNVQQRIKVSKAAENFDRSFYLLLL